MSRIGARFLSFHSSAGRGVALAVAAVAVCCLFAPSAGATCGDWLAHPVPAQVSSDNGQAAATSAGDLMNTTKAAAGGPRRAPCDGPLCKQAPDSPTPPSPVEIAPRPDNLFSLGAIPAVDCAGARYGNDFDWDACPSEGHFLRIEHPPRA